MIDGIVDALGKIYMELAPHKEMILTVSAVAVPHIISYLVGYFSEKKFDEANCHSSDLKDHIVGDLALNAGFGGGLALCFSEPYMGILGCTTYAAEVMGRTGYTLSKIEGVKEIMKNKPF
ncbi:MAG: hypothetical protein NDI94_04065 [Candidatus Woesearchaeota archaeon]|nr:hypothetical protein [Candidatus Woesearchaeota archaeon]